MKSLAKGVITFETPYSDDDFTIKWLKVDKLVSSQYYLFTLKGGERLNGKIRSEGGDSKTVSLLTKDGSVKSVPIHDIVYMKTVEQDLKSRITASIDVGYTYTKTRHNSQFTTRGAIGYLSDIWGINGDFNVVRSKQDSVADIRRTEGNLGVKFFLYRDIFAMASGNFLQNDEQKLKLRSTYKAGIGDYFINSNRMYLIGTAGIAYTNEQYIDTTDGRRSGEGFISLALNLFDVGDLSLQTEVNLYPNLTTLGRYRSDMRFDVKYDFPLDLYIKFGITYNFDSNPIEGAPNSDYVVQATLGWEWN